MKTNNQLNEEINNIKNMMGLITEDGPIPLMTVLAKPANVGFDSKDNTNIIYLTQRDNNGNVIPNSKYSYKVSGTYDAGSLVPDVDFDVILKDVYRDSRGNLKGYAKPTNSFMRTTMNTLVPEKNMKDGWLILYVPTSKINAGITSLKGKSGKATIIDAGKGVKINISKV